MVEEVRLDDVEDMVVNEVEPPELIDEETVLPELVVKVDDDVGVVVEVDVV